MQKCSCSIPGRYSDQVRGTKIQSKRLVETVRSSKSVSFSGIILHGGLAQLGERLPCKQEVSGSNPLISTFYMD